MGGKALTILILVVLAGVAFAVSFTLSRWLGGPAPATAQAAGAAEAAAVAIPETPRIEERHLYDLIKEVRQKLRDCQKREETVAEHEKRLQVTRQLLEKETQDLENLRVQLAASVTRVRDAQAELEKTRIGIEAAEQTNLKRTAAIYDKMDAAAAARILEGMSTNQQDSDAAKILYYMNERSVAKVLAEVTDKGMAARLSEQMKRVKEKDNQKAPATTAGSRNR